MSRKRYSKTKCDQPPEAQNSRFPWLLGEQWSLSEAEISDLVGRADLLVMSPTQCDRSLFVEEVFAQSSRRRVAFLFSEFMDYDELLSPKLQSAGWEVKFVSSCESRLFVSMLSALKSSLSGAANLVVDITGFPVHALAHVVRVLLGDGAQDKVTWLYSEPLQYIAGAETEFSSGSYSVGPLRGFSGSHQPGDEGALVVLAGYDSDALRKVAEYCKGAAPRHLILPFPSLQAQMYQECVLRVDEAKESLGVDSVNRSESRRVPAFDAWGVVEALGELAGVSVGRRLSVGPLSTKPHALGVFVWWTTLSEEERVLVSIIAPLYKKLSGRVSRGVGRVWMYRLYGASVQVT